MKISLLLITSFLGLFLLPRSVAAAVPEGNRMRLDEISDSLPAAEMRSFYAKMEPLMIKIFGPPFSNINLKIEADLDGTVHDTGYVDNAQTLVLAGQARDYQKNKLTDRKHALEQIYGNMLHELSHGMYYYGNKRVSFHPQWVNEGWAKLQEILLAKELGFYSFGLRPYFNYYLDRDTVAGTMNWGSAKQTTNHSLAYDVTSVTHLTLLAGASTANDNLDFFKTFNNRVYDWVKANGQTDISLEQYQTIMRGLLAGKTVDGQPAFDWYFNNPDALTQGKQGNHLGITTEPGEIVAYAFNRVLSGQDVKEIGISDLDVTIKAVNYDDEILVEKVVKTDQDGNARVELPKNGDFTRITIAATATIASKPYAAGMFYFDAPSQNDRLSGVLLDENGKPLPARYISLLKSNLAFEYRDKGVFAMIVPKTTKTVTLDFLGFKQEVTKGPFARMFAMKIPANYIDEAARQPESAIKEGVINNQTKKTPAFVIGIISLIAVVVSAAVIMKRHP